MRRLSRESGTGLSFPLVSSSCTGSPLRKNRGCLLGWLSSNVFVDGS